MRSQPNISIPIPGGAEPLDPVGRRAQAHLVRGAAEADPAVRHAVPDREPAAVAHPGKK